MYFQRKEVLGEPPILASFGQVNSQSSNKRKLSPTFQFFVGIGYIIYLVIILLVIMLVVQPNEIYSSIYSVQNAIKSANWNPEMSKPKNSEPNNIQTNEDIQNWMTYILGPILLNGYVSDQNQVIGASLTKCIGEYTQYNNTKNKLIPSDYGIINTLETSNCNESKMNLISRISEPYKYLENFFDSSEKYVIQEIEKNPTIPTIPKKSKRTDIISYKIELLIYNSNIEMFSVITFSFNLSIFGNYLTSVHSQTAVPINKLIGFPCNNCNFNIKQIMKILLLFLYCLISIMHLIPGIVLFFSSLFGTTPTNEDENTVSVESWSSYFKERLLPISIRFTNLITIILWVTSALIIQLLPALELKGILSESNKVAIEINNGNSSEIPLLNLIIYSVQVASILRFIGITTGCLSTFLILFRIFRIFSSLFSQVNVPLKTVILYFKKIAGIYFFINMILLTLAIGVIIYIQIDKYSAVIRGYKSSFVTSLFLLLLSPLDKIGCEGNLSFTEGNMTTVIFSSILFAISVLYLTLVPLSTATVMFIFNEVEVLQSLKQNTDNIYTIKATLYSWIQQLFFLSTFLETKRISFLSTRFPSKASEGTSDSQNLIELHNISKIPECSDDHPGEDSEKKCHKSNFPNWRINKFIQIKNFFKIPPRLEFIPYYLFSLLVLFLILFIFWIVNIVNYQLEKETGDIIWKILDYPFEARSFYTFNPTKTFSPFMFQECSNNKSVNPPFLYNENQLENIPPQLVYGLFQSFRLGNLTSIHQIKAWMERILIPSVLSIRSEFQTKNTFLTDIGHPTLSPIVNPIFLIKQHFNPIRCNSNPKTSDLYLSNIIEASSKLSFEDISNYNISSTKEYNSLLLRNIHSINSSDNNGNFHSRGLNSINEEIGQIRSSFSSSGVDRVFFLYSGTQSELMEQFNKTLDGMDEGNLFWIVKSYSLSKGSDSNVHIIHSFDQFSNEINANVPYSGFFDFNLGKMTMYFPIFIPGKSSVSLLTIDFDISPTGIIKIDYHFDYVKTRWITQNTDEMEIIVDQKSEIDMLTVEDDSEYYWIFSQVVLVIQGVVLLFFLIILIYFIMRKKYLKKKLLDKMNNKMDISDNEVDDGNNKKKLNRFKFKRFSKKNKIKGHDKLNINYEGKEENNKVFLKNKKKDLLKFRRKKLVRKIKAKKFDETQINDLIYDITDEDILDLYKLNDVNIFIIITVSIIFFILFFLCIRYYILIINTKIAINPNSIDLEGGFNSILTSAGLSLPWEIAKQAVNTEDFNLNMIGSNSGFYNGNIFSIKKLINTISDIKRIGDYFFMFKLFATLVIIIYICFLFLYFGLLIKRHKKVKMLRIRRHFEKTGENILESSLDSVSTFTFMDSASQNGFSWIDANYAFFPILCVVFSFTILFALTGYSILGYQESQFFSFYYSFMSSLMIIYNYNSVKNAILSEIFPGQFAGFYSIYTSFILKPIYFLFSFFTFNFILKALIPASIIFYMRSIASKNLQLSQDVLLSKLNKVAVTRPSIPIFVNDSITLRMKFFIKALYIKLGKIKHLDKQNSLEDEIIDEQHDSNIKLNKDNPDWMFAKLIPELFNEIIHYKLNISELVNKDQQGIQEIRDYLGNISLQLLLIQEHLIKIEFLRCKLSMIRQELMKIEDAKREISRGNRESQHYINRLLQRLMSINDEIEHLDQSNKALSHEKGSNMQKNVQSINSNSLKKEKDKFENNYLFEYDSSYAKELFENSKISDILSESDDENSETTEQELSELEVTRGRKDLRNRNNELNNRDDTPNLNDEQIEKQVDEIWKR